MSSYWQTVVRHEGLNKVKVIKGVDKYHVELRAAMVRRSWDEMWERKQELERKKQERESKIMLWDKNKDSAVQRTEEAEIAIKEMEDLLKNAVKANKIYSWDYLLDYSEFSKEKPKKGKTLEIPKEPSKTESRFKPNFNFLDIVFSSMRQEKDAKANNLFLKEHLKWEKECENINLKNKRTTEQHEKNLIEWERGKQEYIKERDKKNEKHLQFKEKYFKKDTSSIVYYYEMILSKLEYPETFPQEYYLDYNLETGVLIIDYFLPLKEGISNLKEVEYIKSQNKFKEVFLSESALNKLYDSVLYQITLRTIHEIYKHDTVDYISSVIVNGFVRFTNKASGKEATACILSIQSERDEFLKINLEKIDPKTCFKALKGIGSSKLHGLAPIPPIARINREDDRFVDAYSVADSIDDKTNIAAMDWQDFENLIRELFEKEFGSVGGEVKITRASHDEGVDAVVFDPDPIRGGKIIIQAKRYTNTVGVASVRDLYGTVVNEGAIKGILVTTADYGPDAYNFAKDKPLTLLNGNNLLHLLGKHGHRAKIDIKEAKKIIAEQERMRKVA